MVRHYNKLGAFRLLRPAFALQCDVNNVKLERRKRIELLNSATSSGAGSIFLVSLYYTVPVRGEHEQAIERKEIFEAAGEFHATFPVLPSFIISF